MNMLNSSAAETYWSRARFNPVQLLELGGSQFAEIKNLL